MGKILDDETKKKIKQELFIECVGSISIIGILLLVMFMACINVCFGAENKQVKKTVSQSTSKENKIRKQMYNQCVQSGKGTSYCYYLYY